MPWLGSSKKSSRQSSLSNSPSSGSPSPTSPTPIHISNSSGNFNAPASDGMGLAPGQTSRHGQSAESLYAVYMPNTFQFGSHHPPPQHPDPDSPGPSPTADATPRQSVASQSLSSQHSTSSSYASGSAVSSFIYPPTTTPGTTPPPTDDDTSSGTSGMDSGDEATDEDFEGSIDIGSTQYDEGSVVNGYDDIYTPRRSRDDGPSSSGAIPRTTLRDPDLDSRKGSVATIKRPPLTPTASTSAADALSSSSLRLESISAPTSYYEDESKEKSSIQSEVWDQSWGTFGGGIKALDEHNDDFLANRERPGLSPLPVDELSRNTRKPTFTSFFIRKKSKAPSASTDDEADIFERRWISDNTRNAWTFKRLPQLEATSSDQERMKDIDRVKRAQPTTTVQSANSTAYEARGEVWGIEVIGNFSLERKIAPPNSPKQQLQASFIRGTEKPYKSPPVLVHKHSKAYAFSITRTFKSREPGKPPESSRPDNTVLLAARRVQQAFTNTTTTKNLKDYGLLSDVTPYPPRNRATQASSSASRLDEHDDSSRISTRERRSQYPSRPSTANSTQSTNTSPESSSSSISYYSQRLDTSSSSLTPESDLDFPFEEEEEDLDDRVTRRSTHAEAFGTVDPSMLQQLRAESAHPDASSSIPKSKRAWRSDPAAAPSGYNGIACFEPRWMTLHPRGKQEEQKQAVETLNTNFVDVGLLAPATKPKREPGAKKQGKKTALPTSLFDQVPDDALFMLLPLWLGDTDPRSKAVYPFTLPTREAKYRRFLMVYYRVENDHPPPSRAYAHSSKPRSQTSSTGSVDTKDRSRGARLPPPFRILARLVSYQDLQGSNIRIPDAGIVVSGPLQEAYESMPQPNQQERLVDWVIGRCNSLSEGVNFDTECLLRLELAKVRADAVPQTPQRSPNPLEYVEPPEPVLELSPIGRAVIEMAWMGAMSVLHFPV